jgi:hypothetical protein
MWTIVAGPREYSPETSDCALGWAYEIESAGTRRTIRVELSETAADNTSVSEQSATGIRTSGLSALQPFLIRDDPPERIVISARGIYPG